MSELKNEMDKLSDLADRADHNREIADKWASPYKVCAAAVLGVIGIWLAAFITFWWFVLLTPLLVMLLVGDHYLTRAERLAEAAHDQLWNVRMLYEQEDPASGKSWPGHQPSSGSQNGP